MDVQTDERILRNIEGYLMELVCNVESLDEVTLIADVLVSVQNALRDLAQKPRSSQIQRQQPWGTRFA
jgi:hypothetical protein